MVLLHRRNRIGSGGVRDQLLRAIGADADLCDRKAVAHLDQARLGHEVPRRRLLRKLMLRLVVTAAGTQPTVAKIAT